MKLVEQQVACEADELHMMCVVRLSGRGSSESWEPQTEQEMCVLRTERKGWKDVMFIMRPYVNDTPKAH